MGSSVAWTEEEFKSFLFFYDKAKREHEGEEWLIRLVPSFGRTQGALHSASYNVTKCYEWGIDPMAARFHGKLTDGEKYQLQDIVHSAMSLDDAERAGAVMLTCWPDNVRRHIRDERAMADGRYLPSPQTPDDGEDAPYETECEQDDPDPVYRDPDTNVYIYKQPDELKDIVEQLAGLVNHLRNDVRDVSVQVGELRNDVNAMDERITNKLVVHDGLLQKVSTDTDELTALKPVERHYLQHIAHIADGLGEVWKVETE